MRAVVDRADLASTRGDQRAHDVPLRVGHRHDARRPRRRGRRARSSVRSDPAPFIAITFVAAAAAVLGGLRSMPFAFAGGLLLGVAENLVAGYATTSAKDISGLNSSVPFILLLVGLVVMARDRAAGAARPRRRHHHPTTSRTSRLWRRALRGPARSSFLVCYVQFLANDFWVGVIATGLTLSLIFLSFVVVTGMGGMVSLAQGTFVLRPASRRACSRALRVELLPGDPGRCRGHGGAEHGRRPPRAPVGWPATCAGDVGARVPG